MEHPYATDLDWERSISEILRVAFEMYRRYPLLFLMLAVGLIAIYDLAVLAVTGYGPLARHTHRSFQATVVLDVLSFSLIGPLISALHVHAVVLIGEGRRPRLMDVAARGVRVLPVVAAADIVASVGITLGTLALLIPGLILSLRWCVVAQAAAVEREGCLPAIRRSARLASGSYGHIFGLMFVAGALSVGVWFGARTVPLGSSSGVASVLLGIAVHTLTASFAALTFALLYFDLRVREANPGFRSALEYKHVRDLDYQPRSESEELS